jgi:hypothetical protein
MQGISTVSTKMTVDLIGLHEDEGRGPLEIDG